MATDERPVADLRSYSERCALAEFPSCVPATTIQNRRWLETFHDPASDEAARRSARDNLICRNLPLAVEVAKRHAGRGVELADLVQWGAFGLAEAIDRFDLSRPEAFSTYAVHWIRCRITRAVREQGDTIRIPANIIDAISRRRRGLPDYCRAATDGGKKRRDERYRKAIAAKLVLSIETGWRDESGSSGPSREAITDDRAGPEEEAEISDETRGAAARVAALLHALTPREAQVIRLRYGLGWPEMTLEEVGKRLGITRERVRQIGDAAERKMRIAAGVEMEVA